MLRAFKKLVICACYMSYICACEALGPDGLLCTLREDIGLCFAFRPDSPSAEQLKR